MAKKEDLRKMLADYLNEHVFSGKAPADFNPDTVLISSRIISSINVMHLISHLEETLNIEFEAHEINVDNLDTLNLMTEFIYKKTNAG